MIKNRQQWLGIHWLGKEKGSVVELWGVEWGEMVEWRSRVTWAGGRRRICPSAREGEREWGEGVRQGWKQGDEGAVVGAHECPARACLTAQKTDAAWRFHAANARGRGVSAGGARAAGRVDSPRGRGEGRNSCMGAWDTRSQTLVGAGAAQSLQGRPRPSRRPEAARRGAWERPVDQLRSKLIFFKNLY